MTQKENDMSNEKKQNRVELLVESIAVEKQIIDEYCDDLITARDSSNKKAAKEAAVAASPKRSALQTAGNK